MRFNYARYLIQRNSDRPTKAAYIDDHGSLSYGSLADRIQRLAAALLALGIRREERVLLLMHDNNDWPECFLGALYAGIVPVAVNTLMTADDYRYMLQHSRAQAALVSKPTAGLTQHVLDLATVLASHSPLREAADTGPDDTGFWLYSSGSTGKPKGTLRSQANPCWTAQLYGTPILGLTEHDVCFSAAKLFFAYGLGNALSFPLSVGATTLLMAERPTPEAVFKRWRGDVGATRPTVFFGAPTGFAGMLASAALPPRTDIALRLASSAGEALPGELGERFTAHYGVQIIDGIGSTEMLHIFLSNQPARVRYGTTGWPVPGYEIELRGDDGLPVPDGETGDLYIAGPSAALMYWGNREKSRDTFQGRWTKSGDKYVRNGDGSYTYSGRSDDMLKVSGVYVSPFEVEATLVQHAAVLEAAVIGVTDADGLTRSKAFVVLKTGAQASEDELRAFVKDRLAPYKYPRQIAFVAELPKTATGKIQRFRLREQENAARQTGECPGS